MINFLILSIINFIETSGPIVASFLIIIESVIPILPLCVFVSINFLVLGKITGFLISWLCTLLGCSLSFYLCRYVFRSKIEKFIKDKKMAKKVMDFINHVDFRGLSVVTAIPFTPAFLINICSGISKMPYKKFILSIGIGKIFMIYFWGYIGLTFMECLKNPIVFGKIGILLLLAYGLSYVVSKKFKLE